MSSVFNIYGAGLIEIRAPILISVLCVWTPYKIKKIQVTCCCLMKHVPSWYCSASRLIQEFRKAFSYRDEKPLEIPLSEEIRTGGAGKRMGLPQS